MKAFEGVAITSCRDRATSGGAVQGRAGKGGGLGRRLSIGKRIGPRDRDGRQGSSRRGFRVARRPGCAPAGAASHAADETTASGPGHCSPDRARQPPPIARTRFAGGRRRAGAPSKICEARRIGCLAAFRRGESQRAPSGRLRRKRLRRLAFLRQHPPGRRGFPRPQLMRWTNPAPNAAAGLWAKRSRIGLVSSLFGTGLEASRRRRV